MLTNYIVQASGVQCFISSTYKCSIVGFILLVQYINIYCHECASSYQYFFCSISHCNGKTKGHLRKGKKENLVTLDTRDIHTPPPPKNQSL